MSDDDVDVIPKSKQQPSKFYTTLDSGPQSSKQIPAEVSQHKPHVPSSGLLPEKNTQEEKVPE